ARPFTRNSPSALLTIRVADPAEPRITTSTAPRENPPGAVVTPRSVPTAGEPSAEATAAGGSSVLLGVCADSLADPLKRTNEAPAPRKKRTIRIDIDLICGPATGPNLHYDDRRPPLRKSWKRHEEIVRS